MIAFITVAGKVIIMLSLPVPATAGLNATKVVPSLEYRVGGLGLIFPTQIVARRNLNGVGSFGSNVIGGATSL